MYSALGEILEMLSQATTRSEVIDIAKGRYEIPHSWKKIKKHIKNRWQ